VSQNSRVLSSERCRGSLQWPKYGNKKKSGLPAQRYKLKSSVFIVIYGVDVENNNVKQFFEE
jgi:hypothetical protein